ncbi:hypothetical protein RvY_04576 [Ramazzottius varieornatus]|uniref:SP-RING-type domain-containing protein n=1 Tax=Ramazzottius varieornatus TaxID=947166 RepID=A0A1D1UVE5_RAMVA|nr:hypothetical protein RvY_04576 [Ramazzottius varieornatus]
MERLADPRKLEHIPSAQPDSDFEAFLSLGNSNNAAAAPAQNNNRNGGLFYNSQPSSHSSQPTSQSPSQAQAQSKAAKKLEDFTNKFRGALSVLTTVSDSNAFLKELQNICDISRNLIPQKRMYVTAIQGALEEFLQPEHEGGFPEDGLKEVVKELNSALEANFTMRTDIQLMEQIIALMKELPAVTPKFPRARRRSLVPKKRRTLVNDDDEEGDGEAEEEEVVDVEDEYGEVEEEEPQEDLMQAIPDEEEPEASQAHADILKPDYIQKKRQEIAVYLQPERLTIARTIEQVLDKVRTKRGYSWKIEDGELVEKEPTEDDSMLLNAVVVAPKVIQDPISKKEITEKAVRSSKCPNHHLYEEATLRPLLAQAEQTHPRGMKCAYLGCPNYIARQDLVEDEEYARFLSRAAATQQPMNEERNGQEGEETEVFFD